MLCNDRHAGRAGGHCHRVATSLPAFNGEGGVLRRYQTLSKAVTDGVPLNPSLCLVKSLFSMFPMKTLNSERLDHSHKFVKVIHGRPCRQTDLSVPIAVLLSEHCPHIYSRRAPLHVCSAVQRKFLLITCWYPLEGSSCD